MNTISEADLVGSQPNRLAVLRAEGRVVLKLGRHRYAVSQNDLPKYLREDNAEWIRLGSTTYKSSTWALVKK